jgi:hypothetical protein
MSGVDLSRDGVEVFLLAARNDYGGALIGECVGDGGADSAAAACDDRDAAFKLRIRHG